MLFDDSDILILSNVNRTVIKKIEANCSEDISAGFDLDDIIAIAARGTTIQVQTRDWTLQHPIESWNIRELKYVREYLIKRLARAYPITFHPDNDSGGYVVNKPDLPGCVSQAETLAEATEMIVEAAELWLETACDHQDVIPVPSESSN